MNFQRWELFSGSPPGIQILLSQDTLGRDHTKSLLQLRPSADPNDSASVSSVERKINEDTSDIGKVSTLKLYYFMW